MATRKKRQNPFITFMGKFRKTNKGKYDFKQMGREAGKAWHKVKGGAYFDNSKYDDPCGYVSEAKAWVRLHPTDPDASNFEDHTTPLGKELLKNEIACVNKRQIKKAGRRTQKRRR